MLGKKFLSVSEMRDWQAVTHLKTGCKLIEKVGLIQRMQVAAHFGVSRCRIERLMCDNGAGVRRSCNFKAVLITFRQFD
ncbi:hypothetical protein [Celeribacter halophilus]|jgi:hypothetical protein|uniref:hypothetical protein n=1 Tax=Celeribacter halophilus TaxID=576117 RepID=UPI003A9071E6